MEIYITYRLEANSEEDALAIGKSEVKKAMGCINLHLEKIEAQLKEKYPKYPLRTNCLDIEAELWEEKVWQVFTTMQLYLENKFCESGEYNEYDVWDSKGCPLYEDVQEPLFALDWKEIKKDCHREPVDLGLFCDFQFDSVKAVESYSGEGVHLVSGRRLPP